MNLPHGWDDTAVTAEYLKGREQSCLDISDHRIYDEIVEYTDSQQMSDYFRGRREAMKNAN